MERDGSHPVALFADGSSRGYFGSEAADIDRSRARPAAVFDHPLAAIAGRAAIVAVMAGDIVPIARLRRRRTPHAIADDGSWLA